MYYNPKVSRLIIVDLAWPKDPVEVMFNPTVMQHSLSVNYARKSVLGNSHLPLQYLNTGNSIVSFTLFMKSDGMDQTEQIAETLAFLQSLAYAPEQPDGILSAAPPRCLLLWPRHMSMTARLTSINTTIERFTADGEPTQVSVDLTWEASNISKINNQSVRGNGAFINPDTLSEEI